MVAKLTTVLLQEEQKRPSGLGDIASQDAEQGFGMDRDLSLDISGGFG